MSKVEIDPGELVARCIAVAFAVLLALLVTAAGCYDAGRRDEREAMKFYTTRP